VDLHVIQRAVKCLIVMRTNSTPATARGLRLARSLFILALVVLIRALSADADAQPPEDVVSFDAQAGSFPLVSDGKAAALYLDRGDFKGVLRAASDVQADVERVTGIRPELVTDRAPSGGNVVMAGTLGQSAVIDDLVRSGKIDVGAISGQWESFVITTVANPAPGVEKALVIAGSDRRGTIYGLYEISQEIGVSPWYWWADVPPQHHDALLVKSGTYVQGPPGVKYRGIFINDEDWGINPWAKFTFDPQFGNIGPKTYAKVFELMLRLRLNYIWPAMHACSTEFGSVPENVELADEFGIVAGSSHCEPMLCNNVHWNQRTRGAWNFSTNRDAIHSYWQENAQARGQDEAVWTLGIRGIHDAPMQTPPFDMPGKLDLMSEVLRDQRALIDQYVSKKWGPVAQCFVPYKEVLPIYDAGLKVPDDVTLVWADDNFGYIRRFSSPEERKRSGGAGVYWHLSYYGAPHSYTWINTTAPALMWEELHKAWENDARSLWVINVGDIKPAEIGIDYFSRLAWDPEAFGPECQPKFLHDMAERDFGAKPAGSITDLLTRYYRLGTIRKPELMNRAWAMSLSPDEAGQLRHDYQDLLDRDREVAEAIPAEARDAYTEMVGFPARVVGMSGLIFMADRDVQEGQDEVANVALITRLRDELDAEVKHFNTGIAGGKWNRMMPGLVTGKDVTAWSSEVRWPWGEKKATQPAAAASSALNRGAGQWRAAASADRVAGQGKTTWITVPGLGPSGQAMALEPAALAGSWDESDAKAPTLEFDFSWQGGDTDALIDFLPTFRICPGIKLRIAVIVDEQPATAVEVPGSGGTEDERGKVRSNAVQDNFVRATVPLPNLAAGPHVLKLRAMDPGVVIDQVALP
jgi:hypothetical protein